MSDYADAPAVARPVLRLVVGRNEHAIALLVSPAQSDRAQIEDAFPPSDVIGTMISVPEGVMGDEVRLITTAGLRLPLAWTTLCAGRPKMLGAAPVPGTSLHLICAAGEAELEHELIRCAAQAIGQLANIGPLTVREINSSLRLNSLVNNLSVPLLFVDSQSFEVFMNEPARLLLGLPKEGLSNRNVSARLARLVADEYPEARRHVLLNDKHGRIGFEIERQGRTFKVESHWVEDDTLLGRIWLFRDVTEEQATVQMKDQFVASVSHELRTPLTAIIGSLGLMQAGVAGPLSEQAVRLVDVARKNSERLLKLVNELLDMEKIQSGKVDYDFQFLDLRELVAEVIQQNIPYANSFGVSLRAETPAAAVNVRVDPDRMTQVLTNLLSNAAKFSPAGSEVVIKIETAGEKVLVSVIDEGRGISDDFKHKLFRRFSQDISSAVPGHAGSGLGLAISKSIIEAHGGTIGLVESAGKGTTFRLELAAA